MAERKTVNKIELSNLFGVSQQTLTQWQKQGLPIKKKGTSGQSSWYVVRDVIDWYVQFEMQRKFGTADHVDEALNKDYEQARLAKANADGKEIENRIKRGELVPIDFVTKVLAHVMAQITSILDSIPQKLKRRVVKLTASDIEIIKTEIAKIQNAAARGELHLEELAENYIRDKGGVKTPGEDGAA